MDKFLSLGYFFTPRIDPNFQFTKLTLAVGLILFIAGVALSVYRKKYLKDEVTKKLIKKYPGLLRTYGLLTLVLLFARETGIPFVSMRILWVILAVFFLYSALKFAFTFKKEYQKRLTQAEKRGINKKYLPKRKR
jgi:hypothetical protein